MCECCVPKNWRPAFRYRASMRPYKAATLQHTCCFLHLGKLMHGSLGSCQHKLPVCRPHHQDRPLPQHSDRRTSETRITANLLQHPMKAQSISQSLAKRAWPANLLMSCLTESSLVWSIWNSCQLGGAGYLQGQRDVPMTVAPVAATRSAVALPIPVDAPVMSTTLPRRFCTGVGPSRCSQRSLMRSARITVLLRLAIGARPCSPEVQP